MTIPKYDINASAYDGVNDSEFEVKVYDLAYFVEVVERFLHPHRHSFYMLIYSTGGTGVQSIDFDQHALPAGRVAFSSPKQVHNWYSVDELQGYALFFDPEFFFLRYQQNTLAQFGFFGHRTRPWLDLPAAARADFDYLFAHMLSEYQDKPSNWSRVLRSYINIMLHHIERLYYPTATEDAPTDAATGIVLQLEDLLEQDYLEHKQVQHYADALNISPAYLTQVTNKVLGQSARDLIQERVLLEAKRLLFHTQDTIAEVAYRLGYQDPAYFTRFFRTHVGDTPDQFRRKQHRELN